MAYTELNATATDAVDGDLTGNIVIDSSAVNTDRVGRLLGHLQCNRHRR